MKKTRFTILKYLLSFLLLCILTTSFSIPTNAAFPLTDNYSTRKITIRASQSPVPEDARHGHGGKLDFDDEVLSNITFQATKVTPASGYLYSTLDASKPETYIRANTEPIIGTTNTRGEAVLEIGDGPSRDGYYLIEQLTNIAGTTSMKPFVAQVPYKQQELHGDWIYDVTIYPKMNASTSLTSNILIGDLTDETIKQHSIRSGDHFTVYYISNLEPSLVTQENETNGSSLSLKGELPRHVTIENMEVRLGFEDENDQVELTDYILEEGIDYNKTENENSWNVVVTEVGISSTFAEINNRISSTDNPPTPVLLTNVTYQLSPLYEYGITVFRFDIEGVNSYGKELQLQTTYSDSVLSLPGSASERSYAPCLYVGGLRIKLFDPLVSKKIPGVSFVLQDANGKPVLDFNNNSIEATTDSNGFLTINGLLLDQSATDDLAETKYQLQYKSGLPEGYTINENLPVTASLKPATHNGMERTEVFMITVDPSKSISLQLPFTGGINNVTNWTLGIIFFLLCIAILRVRRIFIQEKSPI